MAQSTKRERISFKMLPKSTLELLRCNKCNNYLSFSPVYSFENGINLCESCYSKESDHFKRLTHIRNSLYADAVKGLIFPCQYAKEGCMKRIRFNTRNPYHNDCIYGKCIECPVAKDGFTGTVRNIQDHLKSQHKNVCLNGNEICLSISQYSHKYSLLDMSSLSEYENIILHTQGRMFIIHFSAHRCIKTTEWILGINVSEITYYENCRETFTVKFEAPRKYEPNYTVTCKHQIRTYTRNLQFFIKNWAEQNLNTLFKMSRGRKVYCTISIDIPHTKNAMEQEATNHLELKFRI